MQKKGQSKPPRKFAFRSHLFLLFGLAKEAKCELTRSCEPRKGIQNANDDDAITSLAKNHRSSHAALTQECQEMRARNKFWF